MKMPLFTLILFCLLAFISFGQNLVPNPSFEEFSQCPNSYNQIGFANNWLSFGNTVDYFNSCNNGVVSIPSNDLGFQYARTGNGYGGVVSYETRSFGNQNYREFLAAELLQPLNVGEKYFFSFFISAGYKLPNINCSSNNIGLRFSTVQYSETNIFPIDNISVSSFEQVVNDTSNWVKLSGSFYSDSSYNYVVLGNFFDDLNTDTLIMDNSSICEDAYYFIDDICISTDSTLCFQTNSLLVEDKIFKVFVDLDNNLNVKSYSVPYDIEVLNIFGQVLYFENTIFDDCYLLNADEFNTNLFLVRIRTLNSYSNFKIQKSNL